MEKILIVEDTRSIADMLQLMLTNAGYETRCIYDGLQAWEELQQNNNYDLVLLDRELPNLNGLDLLKQMKADTSLRHIPVVMETSLTNEKHIAEGINAGAYYYLTKPIDQKVLLSVVKAVLTEIRERNQLQSEQKEFEEIFQYLNDARFYCRTLDEAHLLAQGLAKLFPDPMRVSLGLKELLINAVEHGNLAISYEEKTRLLFDGVWLEEITKRLSEPRYKERYVTVRFKRTPTDMTVKISDEGDGFNWQNYLEFSPDRAFDPHGRGIAMANMTSFDSLAYKGNGNTVVASVKL